MDDFCVRVLRSRMKDRRLDKGRVIRDIREALANSKLHSIQARGVREHDGVLQPKPICLPFRLEDRKRERNYQLHAASGARQKRGLAGLKGGRSGDRSAGGWLPMPGPVRGRAQSWNRRAAQWPAPHSASHRGLCQNSLGVVARPPENPSLLIPPFPAPSPPPYLPPFPCFPAVLHTRAIPPIPLCFHFLRNGSAHRCKAGRANPSRDGVGLGIACNILPGKLASRAPMHD